MRAVFCLLADERRLVVAHHGDEAEGEGEDDGDDCRERHALEADRADCQAGRRDADAHDDGRQEQVHWVVVVDFRLDEDADAGSGDSFALALDVFMNIIAHGIDVVEEIGKGRLNHVLAFFCIGFIAIFSTFLPYFLIYFYFILQYFYTKINKIFLL